MPDAIPEQEKHWKITFQDNVEDMLNREPGSVAQHFDIQDGYGGEGAAAIKLYGRGRAQKREDRNGDTPMSTTPRDRVWIYPQAIEWGELIDSVDNLKEMADPTSKLTQSAVEVIQDGIDLDVCIPAFFATRKTGKSGEVSSAFNTAKHSVAVGFKGVGVATSNDSMNWPKLKRGVRLLKESKVNIKREKPVMLLNAELEEALIDSVEKQGFDDIGTHTMINRGFLEERFGVTIEPCEDLEKDSNGYWRVPLFVRSGMHLGFWHRSNVQGGQRADKRFNYQLYNWAQAGATRTQEGKVIEIKCLAQ